ncbi:hypothetical protein MSPP1_000629 [Malassezia sp. CBS 17886]|nr:hypothetical protein MSPP1_000629 [Malassezia sp. CBS 17886]
MRTTSYGVGPAIPASAEEQLRRDIERALALHLPPVPSTAKDAPLSPVPARRPHAARTAPRSTSRMHADTSELVSDEESDDEYHYAHVGRPPSPGNHSALLATPVGKGGPRARSAPRPHLSGRVQEQLDISRLARAGSSPRRASSPLATRAFADIYRRDAAAPHSRHSSAETKVDSDADEGMPRGGLFPGDKGAARTGGARSPRAQPPSRAHKTHSSPSCDARPPTHGLPEHVLWADEQLGSLSSCVLQMQEEIARLRSRSGASPAAVERIRERVDGVERALDRQQSQLTRLAEEVASVHASNRTGGDAAAPSTRHRSARHTAAPLSPPLSVSHTVERLYADLARVANALCQLREAAKPAPSFPHHAAPLTPPLDDDARDASMDSASSDISIDARAAPAAPASDPSPQERYEQVCRAVADALGVARGAATNAAPGAEPGAAPGASPSAARCTHAPNDLADNPYRTRTSRRDRIREHLRQREAADVASDALLRRLAGAPAGAKATRQEIRALEHLFDQHRREFLHQKTLYCELADELKGMEPGMDRAKRRILADHVHESIDTLEAEATRINELHVLLSRCGRAPR